MAIPNIIQNGTNQGVIKLPSNFGQGGVLGNQGQMFNQAQNNQTTPFNPQTATIGNNPPSFLPAQKFNQFNGATGANTGTNKGIISPPNVQQIQTQLNTAKTQLADLTAQQDAMNKYKLTDPSQLTKNAMGNYVPIAQGNFTPANTTFPGLVSTSANVASQPTQNFNQFQNTAQTATTNLMNTAPQQNEAVLAQQKAIQDLTNQYNQQKYNISQGRTNLAEATGEEGALQNLYAGNLGALQTGLSNILQGNAQQQAAYTGAGNLANTGAGVATGQQQAQIQGLEGVAGLTAPQLGGPMNIPFNPISGQYGTPAVQALGPGGYTQYGIIQGQANAGQQYVQNQAIIGKVIPMAQNLDKLISDKNINPNDPTLLNQLNNWARTNIFSDPAVPEFQGQLNDIVASLSSILGIPSNATSDFRTSLAGAIVNGLQNGQSIANSVNYFVQQAQQASQGYLQGAQGASNQGNNWTFQPFFH